MELYKVKVNRRSRLHFFHSQMKLRQDNGFTRVCLSTGGGDAIPPGNRNPAHEGMWDQTGSDIIPPLNLERQKRTVRILLECFLVRVLPTTLCIVLLFPVSDRQVRSSHPTDREGEQHHRRPHPGTSEQTPTPHIFLS